MPACHYCNTESGKRNQFPIRGVRVNAPPRLPDGNWNKAANNASASPLIDEQPFLLHPEIDRPDDGTFFKFYNTGKIEGIDLQKRGEKTIEICDLNRDDLLERRREKVFYIVDLIRGFLTLWSEGVLTNNALKQALNSMVFKKMVEMQHPDQPFSLLAEYIFEHFDEIIVPELATPAQGKAVAAAFAGYRVSLRYVQKYSENINLFTNPAS